MEEFLNDIRHIEKKWQKKWQEDQIFVGHLDKTRKKWFLTVPYPYATGPLHLGHCRTYNLGDIFARYKRQRGYNVFWPMAFHITGTPVLAVSSKIKNKDKKELQTYTDYVSIYEKNPNKIKKIVTSFEEPKNVASFFSKKIVQDFLGMGFSIDDTRQFTTGDQEYNKFIEWQYKILYEKGFITKGNYPILWCVNDKNAVGEDDIQDGDILKVEVTEFIGIKFQLGENLFLVAATLRPETIFGATNVWIHPEAEYNEIEIDKERWIVSAEATKKLKEQNHIINIRRTFSGKEIVNKEVIVPITNSKIPVYPAKFVDTNHATGVVYSVPAHAPYDYAALIDLQNDEESIEKYNLDEKRLKSIVPISLIKVKGYGEFPAVELYNKLGVKNQNDYEKLEQATQTIYKDEYYSGMMKENTREFKGLKVEQAKDKVAQVLEEMKLATPIFETSTKAYCRCGGEIIVAVLQEQYFLNYGDPQWKKEAFRALNNMKIIPEKYRQTFENTFNWLDKRPCVRKRGLGTEFPITKGEGWIIESLSDSVIYMAFYTIIKLIRENNIGPEQLIPEVFDYVFLSKGNCTKISQLSRISEELLKEMKESFEYWYPNDLRHTAIAHISNHLSFAIFHHVAIFPEKYWLQAFSLNEMLIMEGQKMGKSKGNVIPIAQIPNKYSVDLTRLHLASVATAESVVDWQEADVKFTLQRLKKFWEYAVDIIDIKQSKKIGYSFVSKVFLSTTKSNLRKAIDNIEKYNAREYILYGFYSNLKAIENYKKLSKYLQKEESTQALREAIEKIIVSIAPVIPHTAEELHEKMGYNTYVSLKEIPEIVVSEEDRLFALQAKFVENLIEDIEQIIKLVKTKPSDIHIYINESWKNKLYELADKIFKHEAVNVGKIMEKAKKDEELQKRMKEVANEAKLMMKDPTIFRIEMLTPEMQKSAILGYKKYIQDLFNGAKIYIHSEKDKEIYDPQKKLAKARPMKPALLLE
ncbi:MAG: leucine--tRNA ligase [Candidatus Heimdallarchaeaceae archaeon]